MYSLYANKCMQLKTGRKQSCKTDICLSGYLFLTGLGVKAEGTFKIKMMDENSKPKTLQCKSSPYNKTYRDRTK